MSRVLERLDGSLVTGLVTAVVINADGSIDRIVRTRNLITTSGDQFHAKKIAGVTVTAEVVEHTKGPKIRIMHYKNKTGYKRRQGHRAQLTRVRVTGIETA